MGDAGAHAPGHTSTVLSSGEERLIVLGDALHCPAQLTEAAAGEFFYDVDPDLGVRTRQALLQEAEQPGTSLLPCHFPGMQAARLLPATGQRHWVLSGESPAPLPRPLPRRREVTRSLGLRPGSSPTFRVTSWAALGRSAK